MNIVKLQDDLKNLSDTQLAQEMRMPSGLAPQFLVMSEMQRRARMRDDVRAQDPGSETSIADEMVAQSQPQGIVGLPDETLAGAAMRARILGQRQQAAGLTVNPPGASQPAPQTMADGGAVQFGDIFGKGNQLPQQQYAAPGFGTAPSFGNIFQNNPSIQKPSFDYNTPITRQVVPEDRYGAYKAPADPKSFEAIMANLTPEQQARLRRLGIDAGRFSGVGGVGGVGGAAGAAASGAGAVGAGGVGGAGVGGAGFAEGGIASLMKEPPQKMQDGGLAEIFSRFMSGLDPQGMPDPGGYYLEPLDEEGLRMKALAEQARAMGPSIIGRIAGEGLPGSKPTPVASPSSAVSGAPAKSGNAPIPEAPAISKAVEAGMTTPSSTNSFLTDYQKKVSDLLERLGTSEADAERAKNMAIMKAGLAIAAGKDPNFLSNVATGAMSGLEDYSAARDASKKAEAARTAAEIEALGTAARLQQAENERMDTASYRKTALAQDAADKKRYYDILSQRASSANAAPLRALTSLYTSITGQIKANPYMPAEDLQKLEDQRADILAALAEIDPSLALGAAGGGGGNQASARTPEEMAAWADEMRKRGLQP